MTGFMDRNEVFFILTAIVLANAVFVFFAVNGYVQGAAYNLGRFVLLGGTLFAVVLAIRGIAGLREIVAPLFKWRVHPKWYAVAILWPLTIVSVVLLGKITVTETRFTDLAFQWPLLMRIDLLFTVFVGALIGEIVWVSYSIRRLSRRMTTYMASVVVAVFWTLWWMPMAYFDFGIIPGLDPIPLLINQTGVALMCGFLYYHSQSALSVFVMQFSVNCSLLVFPVLPTTGGPTTYLVFAITYVTLGTLAYKIWGPKPLLRSA